MTKADEFVTLLLHARSMAHVAHWATPSFSAHMALGEFYEGISDLMDAFVEQYQGDYNKRLEPKIEGGSATSIDVKLEAQVQWFKRYRYEICDKADTALQNSIDEIVRLYQTTLYKLRMLK